MKKLAIIAASILLGLNLFVVTVPQAQAQTPPPTTADCERTYKDKFGNITDPDGYKTCLIQAAAGAVSAAGAQVTASIPLVKEAKAGYDSKNTNIWTYGRNNFRTLEIAFLGEAAPKSVGLTSVADASSDNGVYGSITSLIGQIYSNPPANTKAYVADMMKNMNIATPAYAQGIGFASLTPILSVWKVFRNISYLGFVIIFLVIGFMIMFRQKISSQTVVTAQQAIPSIIVALLAVTFSYAIAGLLIDAMYIVMFLMAGIFGRTDLIDGNIFQVAGKLISGDVAGTGANAIGNFVNTALGGGAVAVLAQVVTSALAAVIIVIVIIFNTFKLFVTLLKVYVELIIAIVFAPLILMVGAIPGRNVIGPWIKQIVGNLSVFPTILFFLILFEVLRDSSTFSSTTGGFMPPYFGGYSNPQVLPFLAGLAMILGLPTAVEEVKKAIGGNASNIFTTIASAGAKNAGTAADLGIPFLGGAGQAAYGAGRVALRARGEGITSARDIFEKIRDGYEITDGNGNKRRVGGFLPNLQQGFKRGQGFRRQFDDIREGRFADANNLYETLERIQRNQGGGGEAKAKGGSSGGSGGTVDSPN